ncbi:DinB family protein [Microlunatus speluncae]|uniref:DinB family protein n=1 Tax=Microlunatus speluncae TaxID=2594267 RepID=UPI001266355B|nr:DinB family protein [Microlunatus speluncae]
MTEPTDDRRSPAVEDQRQGPPFLAGDRESLETWVEFYRETVPIKIGGLTGEQLCRATVPPSSLTLLGIVRHLTYVERVWFTNVVAGIDAPPLYCADDPDGDYHDLDPARAFDDLDRFHAELAVSRDHAAVVRELDAPLPGLRRGEPVNLRWVYTHLIEEYARHLGHADLIRECLDGTTGY